MKTYNKVVLAGGSGFMGRALSAFYKDMANEVVVLSRAAKPGSANLRTVQWFGQSEAWKKELEDADLLINLNGKNVNCRYTEANKKEIIRSRVDATQALGEAVRACKRPPALWIQVISATIYRHAEDRPMDEASGEMGTGFSVDVCTQWEQTFMQLPLVGTRKVILRTGIVLGLGDGALPRLLNLVKYGLGGMQGNGRQYVSWIHIGDVVRMVDFVAGNEQLQGIYNCVAPEPLHNAEMMRILRKALNRSFGLPAPAWLLRIGAALIGTETELILKSRWVLPKRIQQAGFQFSWPRFDAAINDLLKNNR